MGFLFLLKIFLNIYYTGMAVGPERFDGSDRSRHQPEPIFADLKSPLVNVKVVNMNNYSLGWIRRRRSWCSFLSHSSDINDLLEGLDGVLKDWLDGLHDTESSFHIVDLWLHSLMAFIFLATSTSGCPSSSLLRILAVRAFWMFLMAAVLATAASPSPLASLERAEERVDSRFPC